MKFETTWATNLSGLRKYCLDRAAYYRLNLSKMPPIGDKFTKRGVVGAPHPWDTKLQLERDRANAQARVHVYEKIAAFDITPDTTDPLPRKVRRTTRHD